ncbi:D-alanyl-D-alanine carboxypeptidase/D-alanyl-D-alanine-endopeptidase [Lentibacillus salicampi]|uniref:D-alanyl-D-alanine carboxypeptidase/D-alanyl-D-alanine-endopeptidase n=2 Tax=Lentibacillus salicampi TaxID=175306 RepID=A0A4Y9AGE5_9BACI|nr:D-alanyl-D-alanine carboxypeptidase/D-alanyl-D-alanine-endopeptidase [Lentibacillus salicampi]
MRVYSDRGEGEHFTMEEKLNHLIEHELELKGAIAGVSIRDATTGEKVYGHMGDIRLRPASNMKLLTAAAALAVLGEDYTFTTDVLTESSIINNQLNGDLFLKGKGDPTLLPEDFDRFAKKVKANGIDVIDGDIVADDTWYDDVRLSPDLVWSDEHWYYGAQISALTASPDEDFDAGTVIVEVAPGDAGDLPAVAVTPDTTYVQVENNAKTVASSGDEDLTLNRVHGKNTITINGTIPAGSASVKEWMAVWEPTGYALDLFRKALERQGVLWTGELKTGQAPEKADGIYTNESITLSELLVPFMKLSNNTHVEILVKEMGKVVHNEGSWEKGLEVVETEMEKLGLNMDTSVIRDGSGISHMNLLAPDEISILLHNVQGVEWFQAYLNALPAAGKPDRMEGGTLRGRMNDRDVQAKTGTIEGVSTLSGYLKTEGGGEFIFSIMLNNLLDEENGPAVEDKIVAVIANQ